MSKLNLKQAYRYFMREFVYKKWLQYYNNVRVLAENFINIKYIRYYIVIFEADNKDGERTVYILIENHKEVESPLEIASYIDTKGYCISNKYELLGRIPTCIYSQFIENGLFQDKEKAYGGPKSKGTFGIHRLILSLYDECVGYKVHHINKKRAFNPVCNLVKMIQKKHDNVHKTYNKVSFTAGVIRSLQEQNKLKRILLTPQRFSNAENPKNIIQVLKWRIKT